MINSSIAFVLVRLAIAASMFGHGLVRLPKLPAFSNWMTGNFQNSMLPHALVLPFSYALPVAEFAIGLLLLLGLFTQQVLIAGAIVMVVLIFGSSMIEEWSAIPSQLIHVLFFAFLLSNIHLNTFSVDKLIHK